ncbi:MAG: prolyl-tRNA synthetase associated domain-containing protein [Oscillospiraceae bacterium]|uniref:Proline--tRNA ligase n=1 Tax=Pusillibacter faecalis TaxID=2714358 RepID=A0A810QAA5_9FIRM|nr:prolyl-tRNA synthetase associated domain-containing protein [Pusillibacter faecalis]MCQ5027035.1 prolyl-tRNA synthetase associated domain-containing protein [Oscillibacter valericigenes]BCK85198.1 proline--tRNA ligase [Pusillibacter faecalis]
MRVSQVYTAAPSEERCAVEMETFALLDRLGIPYTWVAHDMANTIEDCAAVDAALGISICKNLFLCNRQKTEFYLLAMPGDKLFQTKELSRQLGTARLSFAPPERMEELLGCAPGSASVLGMAYDKSHQVHLLMDREVYESEWFGCHPCKSDATLRIQTRDLLNIFFPYTGHPVTVVD